MAGREGWMTATAGRIEKPEREMRERKRGRERQSESRSPQAVSLIEAAIELLRSM